jgi:hypothetical protein
LAEVSNRSSLLVSERPSEPRAGPIVAAYEARRGLVVPVSVEREIQSEVAEQLYVIGHVGIDENTPRLGKCRECIGRGCQVGFAEFEELYLRADQDPADAENIPAEQAANPAANQNPSRQLVRVMLIARVAGSV